MSGRCGRGQALRLPALFRIAGDARAISVTWSRRGADQTDWKPMPSVGRGCREVRVRAEGAAYRAIYVTSIGDAVYVLHCFEKKTGQTPKADIDVAKQRYRQAIESIRAKE